MSVTISLARSIEDTTGLAELTRHYLEWDLDEFEKASGLSLDLEDYVSNTMDNLADYMPPDGRLVTARQEDGHLVGMVLLKRLRADAAEIKRLFVDPAARGKGIGRKLVESLLTEACQIGYHKVYLDTGTYMPSAHRLYRSFGFCDTDAYPGSENDESLKPFLIFMSLAL